MTGVGRNAAVTVAIKYYQQPLQILRGGYSGGDYDASGRWVPAVDVPVDFDGAVINATDKDLMRLPEAEREDGMVALYTSTDIYNGDILLWQGRAFRLISTYLREIGSFNKAICGLLDQSEQPEVSLPECPEIPVGTLLLETGEPLLTEGGDPILLESAP